MIDSEMKIYQDTKLDIKQTITVNIKQWAKSNGPSIVEKIDTFFVSQAGSRR
jgi:hypothetical protein